MNTLRVMLVLAGSRLRVTTGQWWLAPFALALWVPVAGAGLAVAMAAWRWRGRRRRRRIEAASVDGSLELLGELLVVGLSAGWGLVQTLGWAVSRLADPVRIEVASLVRRIAREGAAAALESSGGHGSRLYRLIGRATLTGAPIIDAVQGFVDDLRAARRARDLAVARRLPVLLAFPLALLILPGFVLVTIAPAVIGALERLGS